MNTLSHWIAVLKTILLHLMSDEKGHFNIFFFLIIIVNEKTEDSSTETDDENDVAFQSFHSQKVDNVQFMDQWMPKKCVI